MKPLRSPASATARGSLLGVTMKTKLKPVVEVVNVADFIAKLANVYRAWAWFRDHIDL